MRLLVEERPDSLTQARNVKSVGDDNLKNK
jgi:hypothetical protein